VIKVDTDIGS